MNANRFILSVQRGLCSIFKRIRVGRDVFNEKSNTGQMASECGRPPFFNGSGSKYLRQIHSSVGGRVDVYAILEAFDVRCPARQHAIKKLLCAGMRGKGGEMQDLEEARDAVDRAVQMQEGRQSTTQERPPQMKG